MKLNVVEREVDSNDLGSSKFGMETSAKAFRIIMDGLYSDKPQSITREIWSNAFDSHTEAGCPDKPFDIKFPSILDKEFVVRDYGTGLSHEFMMTKYNVVFHSTKEDSNGGVGKWGMGRLSPLSYTDNFTVTSWKDGKVNYYTVMVDSDGAPIIRHMGCEDTHEPNGVRIAFPILDADVHRFKKAAYRVAVGFDIKPNCINDPDLEWPSLEYTVKGDRWYIYEVKDPQGKLYGSEVFNGGGIFAKMGCVLYPVDATLFGFTRHQSNKVIFEFDIGELEVTASREQLAYGRNDPTQKAIESRIKIIQDEALVNLQDSVDECQSPYEAISTWRAGLNNIPFINSSLTSLNKKMVKYKGSVITTDLNLGQFKNVTVRSYSSWSMRNKTFSRSSASYEVSLASYDSKSFGKYILFVVNTCKGKKRDVRFNSRIPAYIQSNNLGNTYNRFLVLEAEGIGKNQYKDIKSIERYFGKHIDVVYVKDLPDTGSTSGKARKVSVKKVHSNLWDSVNTLSWEDTTIDSSVIDKGGYYIPISNNELVLPEDHKFYDSVRYLYGDVVKGILGRVIPAIPKFDNKEIYVVPKTLWKTFDSDDWKNALPIILDFIHDNQDALIKHATWPDDCYSSRNHREWNALKSIRKLTTDKSILDRMKCLDYKDTDKELRFTRSNANYMLSSFTSSSDIGQAFIKSKNGMVLELEQLFKELSNNYPLIKTFGYSEEYEVKRYIELEDFMRNNNNKKTN